MAFIPPEFYKVNKAEPVPTPNPEMPAPVNQPIPQDASQSINPAEGSPAYIPPQPQQPAPLPKGPDLSGYNKITKSLEKAGKIGTEAAQEEIAVANAYMKEQEKFAKEQDDMLQAKYQAVQEKQMEVQNQLDQISSQEIDPNRIFKNMSTGQKIGTVILAALAGSGGIDTLNRMVDMDVKAQVDSKNSKIEAIKGAKTLYSDLLSQHKDVFAARSALKAMQYQAIQTKINALASQTKNAEFQAKLAAVNNDVEANKQKALSDFAERMSKLQQSNVTPDTTLDQITDEKTRERFVPGLGLAATKEDAAKLKENGASTYQALGNIKALKGYLKKDLRSLDPAQRAEIQTEINTLVGQLRVPIVGPGAFTDKEREFVKDMIGDPSQFFSLDAVSKAKLAKLEQILIRSKNATAKAYGIKAPPMADELIDSERVR